MAQSWWNPAGMNSRRNFPIHKEINKPIAHRSINGKTDPRSILCWYYSYSLDVNPIMIDNCWSTFKLFRITQYRQGNWFQSSCTGLDLSSGEHKSTQHQTTAPTIHTDPIPWRNYCKDMKKKRISSPGFLPWVRTSSYMKCSNLPGLEWKLIFFRFSIKKAPLSIQRLNSLPTRSAIRRFFRWASSGIIFHLTLWFGV